MPAGTVPATRFETAALPGREQFDAWRQAISVVFDVEPIHAPDGGFSARVDAYHLGELLLINTRFDSQRFVRTARQVRSDWMDHYLVQFYRQGGYVGAVGGDGISVAPGSVSVLDLAQPLDTRATAAECLSLVVPRDVMAAALPGHRDLHGRVLDGAAGNLFREYMTSLEHHLPGLETTQAPGVSQATMQLLAACLQPLPGRAQASELPDPLLLARIRRHIEAQLDAANGDGLTVAALCRVAGLSRSRLYALFHRHGGVHHYIRERRLLRVHRALADPADRSTIMALAERFGFASHAHLSRLFRERFGYNPSAVRGHPAGAQLLAAGEADARRVEAKFDDWVRTLQSGG